MNLPRCPPLFIRSARLPPRHNKFVLPRFRPRVPEAGRLTDSPGPGSPRLENDTKTKVPRWETDPSRLAGPEPHYPPFEHTPEITIMYQPRCPPRFSRSARLPPRRSKFVLPRFGPRVPEAGRLTDSPSPGSPHLEKKSQRSQSQSGKGNLNGWWGLSPPILCCSKH